jgi:hypothetical protein
MPAAYELSDTPFGGTGYRVFGMGVYRKISVNFIYLRKMKNKIQEKLSYTNT